LYVHYHDWGTNYGRDLASGENLYILEKISNNCEETNERELDEILNKFKDSSNIIIFAINLDLYEHFEDPNSFIFKGYKNSPQFNVAYFGNIRTLFSVLSGQYNGISGHLVESLNKRYPLIIMIKRGPNNEENGYAKNERNTKIKTRIRIIVKRNRSSLQLWKNNGIRDSHAS